MDPAGSGACVTTDSVATERMPETRPPPAASWRNAMLQAVLNHGQPPRVTHGAAPGGVVHDSLAGGGGAGALGRAFAQTWSSKGGGEPGDS